MNLLLFAVLLLLLLRFPPGTNLEWTMGGTRVVWPVGWSLAITLILSVILSVLKKN
jgi:hypothetical protein